MDRRLAGAVDALQRQRQEERELQQRQQNNGAPAQPQAAPGNGAARGQQGGPAVLTSSSSDDGNNSSSGASDEPLSSQGLKTSPAPEDSGSSTSSEDNNPSSNSDSSGRKGRPRHFQAGEGGDTFENEGEPTSIPHYRDYAKASQETNGKFNISTLQNPATKEPTFPMKLHMILANRDFQDIVTWLPHGRAWRVLRPKIFEDRVIPMYFRHGKFSSFLRQVNGWNFKRVTGGADFNSYYHELFLRGLPHLTTKMRRMTAKDLKDRKPAPSNFAPPDFYNLSKQSPVPESFPITTEGLQFPHGGREARQVTSSSASLDVKMPPATGSTADVLTAAKAELAKLDKIRVDLMQRIQALENQKQQEEMSQSMTLLSNLIRSGQHGQQQAHVPVAAQPSPAQAQNLLQAQLGALMQQIVQSSQAPAPQAPTPVVSSQGNVDTATSQMITQLLQQVMTSQNSNGSSQQDPRPDAIMSEALRNAPGLGFAGVPTPEVDRAPGTASRLETRAPPPATQQYQQAPTPATLRNVTMNDVWNAARSVQAPQAAVPVAPMPGTSIDLATFLANLPGGNGRPKAPPPPPGT